MLEKFLPRIQFDSYEDFKKNYTVNIPENFNFGFDIVDGWAKEKPDNRALVWCNDHNEEKVFTFEDMSKLSNRAANFFAFKGIKKGSLKDYSYKVDQTENFPSLAINKYMR